MLTVDEALALVLERAQTREPAQVSASEAMGLVLAEDIVADLDLPPFDKALVDGYAIRTVDLSAGSPGFRVIEEVPAGRTPTLPLDKGEATLVMTGAPLPRGADAVVMLEKASRDGDTVRFHETELTPGRNRLPRAREMKAGDVVLRSGRRLGPIQLGLLASVGRSSVRVVPRPSALVLPTGDELVDAETVPGPGQIRNSNGPMLLSLAKSAGANARLASTARDVIEDLQPRIAEGLREDMLIISGGVSAGNRDLVPSALEALGATRVFHKLRLKPGKPLWFGIGPPRGERPGTLVFGLPGNPVGGVVGFVLLVAPALARLAGLPIPRDGTIEAKLSGPFRHAGDRPTYHPSRLEPPTGNDRIPRVTPMDWAGSSDLRTVAAADGFAVFPAGDREYVATEIVRFLPLG